MVTSNISNSQQAYKHNIRRVDPSYRETKGAHQIVKGQAFVTVKVRAAVVVANATNVVRAEEAETFIVDLRSIREYCS